jgi:hypothetical protein
MGGKSGGEKRHLLVLDTNSAALSGRVGRHFVPIYIFFELR